jgi:hypothetical protein
LRATHFHQNRASSPRSRTLLWSASAANEQSRTLRCRRGSIVSWHPQACAAIFPQARERAPGQRTARASTKKEHAKSIPPECGRNERCSWPNSRSRLHGRLAAHKRFTQADKIRCVGNVLLHREQRPSLDEESRIVAHDAGARRCGHDDLQARHMREPAMEALGVLRALPPGPCR